MGSSVLKKLKAKAERRAHILGKRTEGRLQGHQGWYILRQAQVLPMKYGVIS